MVSGLTTIIRHDRKTMILHVHVKELENMLSVPILVDDRDKMS